jgi:hypothetical protein
LQLPVPGIHSVGSAQPAVARIDDRVVVAPELAGIGSRHGVLAPLDLQLAAVRTALRIGTALDARLSAVPVAPCIRNALPIRARRLRSRAVPGCSALLSSFGALGLGLAAPGLLGLSAAATQLGFG